MNIQTVRDVELKGKKVLLRSALNVPITNNKVTDAFRIESALPTMKYLVDQGASIMLLSHHSTKGQSLEPVKDILEDKLGRPVTFIKDSMSEEARLAGAKLNPGEVILFENLRFHPEEELNDPVFSKALADLGDIYVDDDFTTMHRVHASIVGIPQLILGVAGLLVEKEVNYITGAIDHPKRPLTAVVGGAKVSTKIELLRNLIPKVDMLFLGGAMANTFLLAQGHEIGKSVSEPELIGTAVELMDLAIHENCELFIPDIVTVSKSLTGPESVQSRAITDIQNDEYIVDVSPSFAAKLGPAVNEFLNFEHKCTVLWNGPLGLTSIPEFAAGSLAMADAITVLPGVSSIVGGGDTAGFLDSKGLQARFTWISTGGGASLELMGGNELPGLAALKKK